MNNFGQFLRELRGNHSLREMANLIGISHVQLSNLEKGVDPRTGKFNRPSLETIKKLAKAYNYDYETLMNKAGYFIFDENNVLSEEEWEQAEEDWKKTEEYKEIEEETHRKLKQHWEDLEKKMQFGEQMVDTLNKLNDSNLHLLNEMANIMLKAQD
ncbi:helix-turn-helix domain-containing protein [Bacillus cereus]|uniref:helix-turn-helix domain-containing protein n=1 Tax=Bacillus cereus TaxID=1396 RepID=UPI003D171DAF